MTGWEILYADGSVFTSEDGGPEWAPRTGVQAILQDDPDVGVQLLGSSDGSWFWRFGRWWPSDQRSCHTYRTSSLGEWCLEVEGEWVPDARWWEIQQMVKDRKSAWKPGERRIK